jgi:hypothetical protein
MPFRVVLDTSVYIYFFLHVCFACLSYVAFYLFLSVLYLPWNINFLIVTARVEGISWLNYM